VRDLRDIAAVRDRVGSDGPTAVLATVVKVTGSAYRGAGARLLVLGDDTLAGGVSGGCLERDVIARAERLRATGRAELVSYDLTKDDGPWGLGMRCGGNLSLLLEPLAGGFPDHLAFLLDAAERRGQAVVATLFRSSGGAAPAAAPRVGKAPAVGDRKAAGGESVEEAAGPASGTAVGARLMLDADGRATGALGGGPLADAVLADALAAMAVGRTAVRTYLLPGGEAEVLMEFVPPPIALLICGDEREAAPLMSLAGELGWRVRLLGKHDAVPPLDERSAAVVMTHNDARDLELLPALLASPAPYVGLLGSRTRTGLLLKDLRERGALAAEQALPRLYTPAGLDIGAETPGEVALAIVAEIQAVFAGRAGGPLRERKGPLHVDR
jgi:xanthine dehydrogenase accessory factor